MLKNASQPQQPLGFAAQATPSSAASGASSVTPSGGAGSGVGGQFDYQNYLANDPFFSQLRADLSAQGISDAAQRSAARIRTLTQFGEVPQFDALELGLAGPDLAQDLTNARPLAERATSEGLSLVARMNRLRQDNIRQIRNSLAARGALRSGESGFQLGREEQRFKEAQFDSRSQLLDVLRGIQEGFLQAERQRQASLREGAMGAYERAIASGVGGSGSKPANEAPPDSATGMPEDQRDDPYLDPQAWAARQRNIRSPFEAY